MPATGGSSSLPDGKDPELDSNVAKKQVRHLPQRMTRSHVQLLYMTVTSMVPMSTATQRMLDVTSYLFLIAGSLFQRGGEEDQELSTGILMNIPWHTCTILKASTAVYQSQAACAT